MPYGSFPEWDRDEIDDDLLLIATTKRRLMDLSKHIQDAIDNASLSGTKAAYREFADMLDAAESDTLSDRKAVLSMEIEDRDADAANRTYRPEQLSDRQKLEIG